MSSGLEGCSWHFDATDIDGLEGQDLSRRENVCRCAVCACVSLCASFCVCFCVFLCVSVHVSVAVCM